MKITRYLVPLMLLCALPAMALSDKQVINYIKTQAEAGKSQDEIGQELLAKGVTPEQIKRIKAQYEKEKIANSGNDNTISGSRMRKKTEEDARKSKRRTDMTGNIKKRRGAGQTNPDLFGMEYNDSIQIDFPDIPEKRGEYNEVKIYGHDMFDSRDLSFEPNMNLATPQNYRLGPGDEVIIDIWGASEDNIRAEISPDGSIIISQLGPVHLNGMTVAEANRHVKNIFARKYAGVGTETDISLTLGNIRSIQVDVMGEVTTPGSYRLSPFSNVFHALYSAGGINDIASLRNIYVVRNGKKIADTDLYEYLFKGTQKGNIRLQEGDIIMVPAYSQLVGVEGNVKRPMYYEMKPSESLAKLIDYAGGFAGDAYSDVVRIQRLNGLENELYTVEKADYPSYLLRDGDIVTIGQVNNKFANKVELMGAVNRPGTYALGKDIKTLKSLLKKAEGLAEDAYLDRALIYREKPDRSLEVVAVNIGDVMNGSVADIALKKNDIIKVANVNEITEKGDLTINGFVTFPGQYPYAEGMTVEDLVLQAGGLREGASTARVEVARRIIDQNATDATNQIAEVFTFGMKDGIAVDGKAGFLLKPYDVVQIRRSPTYSAQEEVTIAGQVLFPGKYVLQSRNERISEVMKRAGGLLESAYVKGAYLKRQMTEDQKQQIEEAMRMARMNAEKGDSIELRELELAKNADTYNVGIDLQKAVENPGSTYDFVLQAGDELNVPEYQSTVQISGQVLFPNTVVFVPGKKMKYYIEQAGGYNQKAKKGDTYVVYMNGSVAKAKGSTPIEPGCRIVVPEKENKKFDWTPVFSIIGTLSSLTSVAATVVALTR